jgi:hypothetical protein
MKILCKEIYKVSTGSGVCRLYFYQSCSYIDARCMEEVRTCDKLCTIKKFFELFHFNRELPPRQFNLSITAAKEAASSFFP